MKEKKYERKKLSKGGRVSEKGSVEREGQEEEQEPR